MTKRMSAGLSRDVEKKVLTVHPVLWERMEAMAHKIMGTDPSEIKLTNQQVLTALVAGVNA
tara:strand:- start:1337 stop:1519 length:183 start_codon:yes stop_codon:yes gene_type:complete